MAAAERLLLDPQRPQISISAIGREADITPPTVYIYFGDVSDVIIAILETIMASADQAYLAHLRTRWPDPTLDGDCLKFVLDFNAFWMHHRAILNLRNSYASELDERMVQHRSNASRPVIAMLVEQMDGDPADENALAFGIAVVLLTSLERLVTIANFDETTLKPLGKPPLSVANFLHSQARLLMLAIRDCRASSDRSAPPAAEDA